MNFQPEQGKVNAENRDHGPGVGQPIGGFGRSNEIDDKGELHRGADGIVNANDADPPRLQQPRDTCGCRGVKLAPAPGDYGLIVADEAGLLGQEGGGGQCDASKSQIRLSRPRGAADQGGASAGCNGAGVDCDRFQTMLI